MERLVYTIPILFLLLVPAFSQISNVVDMYNQNIDKVPAIIKSIIGNEKVRILYQDGDDLYLAYVVMNKGYMEDFNYVGSFNASQINEVRANYTQYNNITFTLEIFTNKETVEKIINSEDPLNELLNEWGKGIKFKPLNAKASIKTTIISFGLKIYSFIIRFFR